MMKQVAAALILTMSVLFGNAVSAKTFHWQLEKQLKANDAADSDIFGFSVAVSGDVAVIGAPFEDDNGENFGAAYVFVRYSDDTWHQEAKLIAGTRGTNDFFGKYVAVSDNTALIGNEKGEAYVYIRQICPIQQCSDATDTAQACCGYYWQQQAKLTALDGAVLGPVSLSGDIAVIGAPRSNSAYVFVRSSDGAWHQEAKLAAAGGQFGFSVSVSGETALIGARGADSSGAAYVFIRGSGTIPYSTSTDSNSIDEQHWWSQQAKLVSDDGAAGSQFGYSVSLSGGTALIGAPFDDKKGEDAGAVYMDAGAVYIFVRQEDGSWKQTQKLTASDAVAYQHFGSSVSLDSVKALIGAQWYNVQDSVPGSTYIFITQCPGCGWYQEDKIAEHGTVASFFGWSVSLSGDIAVVGAHTNDDDYSGSAYVFRRQADMSLLFLSLPAVLHQAGQPVVPPAP